MLTLSAIKYPIWEYFWFFYFLLKKGICTLCIGWTCLVLGIFLSYSQRQCCKFAKLIHLHLAANCGLQVLPILDTWGHQTEHVHQNCRSSLCPDFKDSNGQHICTVLHVDYHCLYSILLFFGLFFFCCCSFFFFFCFHLGWGRPVCARVWICVCVRVSVSIGEGLKEKIIPNFLMYCFCSPAPLLLYHFKFWPQASSGPRASRRLQRFLYFVMNVNRCFYYTKLNVIELFVVFSVIHSSFLQMPPCFL